MKRYRVIVNPRARRQTREAANYFKTSSPDYSKKWLSGLSEAIQSLSTMPARCAQAREAKTLGADLHQLLYQSHRIIFRIEEKHGIVRIMQVRHAAMRTSGDPYDDSQE